LRPRKEEEEENATEIVNLLEAAGAGKVALFIIDGHLGKREFKA